MLEIDKKAPTFKLNDKDGTPHSLSSIDTPYIVLFFYPKDNTPGCTIEARGFSEALAKFKRQDTTLIGISGGDERSKTKFCEKHDLGVLLLSDTDFSVSKKYGAYGPKQFMGKKFEGITRASFILGPDRKIIQNYPKVKPSEHPQEVLEFIKQHKKSVKAA
jgi:peroxiredoxin Q/BCP